MDWDHAEAIVNVVQLNLMALRGVWMDTRPPVGLEATRAYSVAGAADRSPADWACIEAHGEDMCVLGLSVRIFTSSLILLYLYQAMVFSDFFGACTFVPIYSLAERPPFFFLAFE